MTKGQWVFVIVAAVSMSVATVVALNKFADACATIGEAFKR